MTDPDFLVPFSGRKFRTLRSNADSPETFTALCLVTTQSVQRQNEFDDTTTHDCNNPNDPSWRASEIRLRSWSVPISGTVDAARLEQIREDADADEAVRYKFEMADTPGASGGGAWVGAVWYENFEVGHQNRGTVNFSATLRGNGELLWIDAA